MNIKEKIKKSNKSILIISIIMFVLLIISCISILSIAKYSYPLGDDYSFGRLGRAAWNDTHSIIEVIKATFSQVGYFYTRWQGTFTAIFFMAFCPAIFSESLYGIGTYVLLTTFVISTIYLINTISKICFKNTKKAIVNIIACVITIISLQYVPSAVESFYWFNGSMYYTFFYSIMLFLIAFILRLINCDSKKRKIIYGILIYICAILVGGANYVTALTSTILLVCFSIYTFITKNKSKYVVLVASMLTAVSFAISILAPGNQYRQAECDSSLGVIGSIIKSIEYAITYFTQWFTPVIVISLLFIIPLIYAIIRKSNFQYKYPILVTIFSFGLFASQFTPPLYAMNNIGGTRLINIVYYSYLWLLLINITYYIGWINRKINNEIANEKNIGESIIQVLKKYVFAYFGICTVLFIMFFIKSDYKNTTTIKIIDLLKTGEVQLYAQEMNERIYIYNDESITDVEVKDLTVKPSLLYCGDLSEDADNWRNKAMCVYYKKNSIVRKPNR